MIELIEFKSNEASALVIAEHLLTCDLDFAIPLNGRIEINEYASKIANKATRLEAWLNGKLIGLVALYCDDQKTLTAHITSVSVIGAYTKKGIAATLLMQSIKCAKISGMRRVSLEVAKSSASAIRLYKKYGFNTYQVNAEFVSMHLYFKDGMA